MFSKKRVPFFIATIAILLFSESVFAESFSLSFGVPIYASFDNSWNGAFGGGSVKASSVAGFMVHVKFPLMFGIGLESYKTQINSPSSQVNDLELSTLMYDVSISLPVPVVNVTVGAGIGSASLSCQHASGSCSSLYEDGNIGSARQLWGQVGFPILPAVDIHASLHRVSTKIEGKSGVSNLNLNGNVIAVGASIGF